MTEKRNVILVTDGDLIARRTLEVAAQNVGARCISMSAGNPTRLSGQELVELIKSAAHDPVVVMFDDKGKEGQGLGEKALLEVYNHPDINILGVLAVASNSFCCDGAKVDVSVLKSGDLISGPVNKFGKATKRRLLQGDTVEILNDLDVPVIVGIGDIGKMEGADDYHYGARVTTRALHEIIERSGFNSAGSVREGSPQGASGSGEKH
ncbi:stage V sporulation protein AE, C-terminal region [Desulfotomaculum nigrificans CO-1-SRB]|uniref:Stage V sporulation protein AE, C-terminal region n=1 Tax=Desulfotomaculum nigrificans (strain DSM 14880 / VKM B-2319 / CO-1-SRB) TaxID=868595 RepID=F6B9K7_DESCC|nr:stage V sporulation protein AE [Desulfotomaculum nigrificans]AEF94903.1 stage V sporulation protein AE, C-terminal region [Desulfotomaculum nigrificans CO-1-SRB]